MEDFTSNTKKSSAMPTGKSSVMYMNPMYLKDKKKGKAEDPNFPQRVIPTKVSELGKQLRLKKVS